MIEQKNQSRSEGTTGKGTTRNGGISMARLLMKNASHIVTCDPSDTVYTDSNLLMEDGVITYIGPEEQQAEEVIDAFTAAAADFYEKKEQEFTSPVMREVERVVLLRVVDEYWMDHIDAMTDLRQGIGLRAYAQTDPIIAYKKESLEMFEEMISAIQEETVRRLYSVRLRKNEEVKRERVAKTTSESVGGDGTVKKQPRKVKKIGRNEPCPCGSGKKYKNCCGRDA